MPWQKRWPPYVPRRVAEDRHRAASDLDQASDDLRETAAKAVRAHRVADRLAAARERNHFSESMELLFTPARARGTFDDRHH